MPKRPVAAVLVSLGAGLAPAAADAAAPKLGDRTLRINSTGTDVRQLQRALTRLEVRTAIDGHFGPGTRRSVRAYERANSQPVDGVVTPAQGRGIARRAAGDRTPSAVAPLPVPEVPGRVARLSADGRQASAPAEAPEEVKAAIAAANKITDKPYRYGGGHAGFEDTGYDCSGAISVPLNAAGILDAPLASGPLMRWGSKGRGEWITVYAHTGHAYVMIAGLRFDTSGRGEKGPRWRPEPRSSKGFVARYSPGL